MSWRLYITSRPMCLLKMLLPCIGMHARLVVILYHSIHFRGSMSQKSDRIGTALIGCGKVGDTHARALKQIPESDFVAVFDTDQDRAQAFATRFGVQAFTDLGQMLSEKQVQMANICTPNYTHA